MKQNTASQRIAAELRARIRSGKLAPGERLPSVRALVAEHGVALATATKALAVLKKEGLVRVKPGVGTLVRGAGEAAADPPRARIVEAAIAIADDEGTDALSMRLLARELGLPTMSLYRHVASKDELLIMMADAVLAESPPPRPAKARARLGWRARLEQLARAQWAGYRRHPWLPALLSMTRPAAMKHGMAHTEHVMAALADAGIATADLLRTGVAFLAYVRGMAVSLEAEERAEQDSGMSNAEWMRAQEPAFAPLVAAYPTLARLAALPDSDMSLDALFETGLALVLDGLERRAGRARA
ncbi:MAG: TetR/AcrR family transcriptional regulator C-terminal domain-containing protein [Myxococcota bacterium]